jgi:hypothetical protein
MKSVRQFDLEVRAKAGRIAAATVFEKFGYYFTRDTLSKAGRISTHLKWHVNRGIVNPNCELCIEGVE